MADPSPILRASEIGQYAYCARAWWLARVKGYRSLNVAAMERGTEEHRAHGRKVEAYHRWRQVALWLIALGGALLLVGLLVGLGR